MSTGVHSLFVFCVVFSVCTREILKTTAFFFFNDTATTEIYTLSLHDALPICFAQHLVPVEGQTDVLTMGLPYICPYNVHSIMNPILVMCLGLGYFFNMYRQKPLVREGGVLIMSHPTPWAFHPVQIGRASCRERV